MARHLARHISRIPPSALPLGFLEKAGLHGTAAEILDRHSMASLVRRYSALLRAHLQHAQAQLEEEKQSAVEKRERLEVIDAVATRERTHDGLHFPPLTSWFSLHDLLRRLSASSCIHHTKLSNEV